MKQEEKKSKKIIYVFMWIIIGFVLGISLDRILLQKWSFFEMTLIDIIQCGIEVYISYRLYRLAKKDNQRDKINNKAKEILETIISIIDNKIEPLEKCMTIENLKINVRELSNNITILKKILLINKEYETDIEHIEKNYIELESYIAEHNDMTIDDFLSEQARKDKVVNFIEKIRSRALDVECDILVN